MTSGDTTVQYAVEGTPLTFSRADSLSSLESESDPAKLTAIPEEKGMQETEGTVHKEQPTSKDNRTVSFNTESEAANVATTYADVATPSSMQLSRASSVNSLESFKHHFTPIRSTYTSCATSNRASPVDSELPDSPTQQMPPNKFSDPPGRPLLGPGGQSKGDQRPPPPPPLAPKFEKPMFGDNVKSFKEEGTPLNFSTRTSLSGLTFDDDGDVATGITF